MMMDLGQTYFEHKRYFFEEFDVHQILVNPPLRNYPELFLICREQRAGRACEYAVGLSLWQFNELLMQYVPNRERIEVALSLSEAMQQHGSCAPITVRQVLGISLHISTVNATTVLKRLRWSAEKTDAPLYYFNLAKVSK